MSDKEAVIYNAECPHGLDMRLHPRCYLCKPLGVAETPQPDRLVIRPYVGPMQSGGTSSVPWCSICAGWHLPNAGPCTATYSNDDDLRIRNVS